MKLKQLLRTALTLILVCLLVLPANAASTTKTSGLFTYSVSNGKATIRSCSSKAKGTVTVPAKIGGYPVIAISSSAFDNTFNIRKNITGVIISEGITTIGDYAFNESNIKSVTIPSTVKTISEGAFFDCKKLTKVKIAEGLTTIGDRAFEGCKALTSITLPNSLTHIGDSAFMYCRSLKSIRIPDLVTHVGNLAFAYCDVLKTATLGSSISEMGEQVFTNCYKLTKANIPNGLKVIPRGTFNYCKKLTTISIPSSVKTIKKEAFSSTGITTIYYNGTKAQWKKITIDSPSTNTKVAKPKKVTYVSQVKITKQPKSITVKKSKTASFSVSASGSGLTYSWYYNNGAGYKKTSTTAKKYSVKMSSSYNGRKLLCIVKDKYGFAVKTKEATLSLYGALKITTQPKSVVMLEGHTAKMTVAAQGDGLTYSWYYAQKGATKYTKASCTKSTFSVKMAKKWDKCKVYCVIKDKYGNKAQTKTVSFSLPSKKQYCGKNIMWQIDSAGTMTLTGSGAMYDYNNAYDRPYADQMHTVKKVVVGNGITALGWNAFSNADILSSVSLPNTLKTIGIEAFANSALKQITIPDSVTTLEQWAFQSCRGFTTFTISAGIQTIGLEAFSDCGYLETFKVSSKNKYFTADSYGALYNKDKTVLHYVPQQLHGTYLLPNTMKEVLNDALADARSLTAIIYRGTLKQWKALNIQTYSNTKIYCAVTNGKCGPNVKWDLNAKGVLTISGTGAMDEYLDRESTWVNFPEAITSIVIKSGVTSIGNYAFSGATFLTSVSIPATVKTIGTEAFFKCSKLKSIVLPKGISIIKSYTFSGCTALTSIYIPSTVKTIDFGAFSSCENLKTVKYGGSSSAWKKISIKTYNDLLKKATIQYNVSQPIV